MPGVTSVSIDMGSGRTVASFDANAAPTRDQLARACADRDAPALGEGHAIERDHPGFRERVIVDDELLFVTSANLTEAALDRNIELGLLVRDRTLAVAAANRFRGLIERGLLSKLPSR